MFRQRQLPSQLVTLALVAACVVVKANHGRAFLVEQTDVVANAISIEQELLVVDAATSLAS